MKNTVVNKKKFIKIKNLIWVLRILWNKNNTFLKGIKYSLECKQKHSTIMQKRLYKDYKNINPEIKWNEFFIKI